MRRQRIWLPWALLCIMLDRRAGAAVGDWQAADLYAEEAGAAEAHPGRNAWDLG